MFAKLRLLVNLVRWVFTGAITPGQLPPVDETQEQKSKEPEDIPAKQRNYSDYDEAMPEAADDVKCPDCKTTLVLRSGDFGWFYGCPKFPHCEGKRSYKSVHGVATNKPPRKLTREYTVVRAPNVRELVDEVNDHLRKGWWPQGGITAVNTITYSDMVVDVCQPMIRR